MNINKYIDHTALKSSATESEIKTLCSEAKEFGFKSVCVNPCDVSICYEILKVSDIKVCT